MASAVYHSIIIPHRRRLSHLGLCLRSLAASARITGLDQPENFEVLVVHNASPSGPGQAELPALRGGLAERCPWARLIVDDSDMPVFCKSWLLNRGIEEARGEILTFLDADAIVGRRWLEGVTQVRWEEGGRRKAEGGEEEGREEEGGRPKAEGGLSPLRPLPSALRFPPPPSALCPPPSSSAIHRLCYRVKKLPLAASQAAIAATPDEALEIAWRSYDRLPRAFEAWGQYNRNAPTCVEPPVIPHGAAANIRGEPWGNSQFSIPCAVLGGLRYDEEFRGHGFEDLAMMRAISERLGKSYRAQLLADPDHALIHLSHPYEPDWKSPATTTANLSRYGKIAAGRGLRLET